MLYAYLIELYSALEYHVHSVEDVFSMDMKPAPFLNKKQETIDWSSTYFNEQGPKSRFRPLTWWYRMTAPPEPALTANFAQREIFRRGRLNSIVLLVTLLFLTAVLPIAIKEGNRALLIILIVSLIMTGITLPINRSGRVTIVGTIMVSLLSIGLLLGIIGTPGGLASPDLVRIDLLVIPELLAVSLLPGLTVFPVALGTSIFTWIVLTYGPRNSELIHQIMAPSGYGIIVRPIALQIIVAIVTFLWVRSATQAIARADRAEAIAALEHTIAEQEHAIAEQKVQLDASIDQIVQTHMRVSNGDFSARVPLNQDNVLWQISGSLNNLLTRFQHYRQEAQELQRVREEAMRLVNHVREVKARQKVIPYSRGGTVVDMIAMEVFPTTRPSSPQNEQMNGYNGGNISLNSRSSPN